MKSISLLTIVIIALLSVSIVFAHGDGEDDLAMAKQLIDSKVSCSELNDAQLELMGDYYMEQMHPGEAHEELEDTLGGEGSENLKQTHIMMAKQMYCGEKTEMMSMMGKEMMNMDGMNMMNMGGMHMMNGGMMGSMSGWSTVFGALWFIILLGLAALIWLWVIRLWKKK